MVQGPMVQGPMVQGPVQASCLLQRSFSPGEVRPNSVKIRWGDFQGTRSTILERLKNGSMSVWGKVDQVDPPHLVMPITIEPTKPRMCHDERYLNLWIRDLPLTLDYISNLPRYVGRGHFQTTMDDKSGYDHVLLSPERRTYFGLHWGGLAATSYVRSLGVPCSQYIDDRHVGQLAPRLDFASLVSSWSDLELAEAACFICASVLTSLGYFIGLAKCSLSPLRSVKFLGFVVDSERAAFFIPHDKKEKFATLRESILGKRSVPIKTLQRLAGKITSFTIAVPVAQLYAREIYLAIAGLSKSSRLVKVAGPLRREIEHWHFLDSWKDCLPWPQERHTVVKIFADASDSAWGGTIQIPGSPSTSLRDYWPEHLAHCPIVIKEAFTLRAAIYSITNARLDVHTDNMAFMLSWRKQGGKSSQLNTALKELHLILWESGASMTLSYVPSSANPADAPSRVLSEKDCMLSRSAWLEVERCFGPHSIDLMALESNVQRKSSGQPLRHFSPFPSQSSEGINVFAQCIAPTENAYVFPPFVLVGPLLKFLRECKVSFSMVVPRLSPLPYWWPLLYSYACASFKLGTKGDFDGLLFPSSYGQFIRFFFSTLTLIVSILFFGLPSNQIRQQALVSYKCFVNSNFRQPVRECFESSRGSDIEVVSEGKEGNEEEEE
ncbi:hypothetical protein QZH41_001585 [Actinostola sp. cb2023]|nr:hypothetical protein QZH41_001585 [Actinostola sp. cb2023]